jgi:nicotinate-nucleotide pyrophosphorylase (carboxylating)
MTQGFPWDQIDPLIEATLKEDFGKLGDLTTDCTVPMELRGRGEFVVREAGIIAGLPIAARIIEKVDSSLTCQFTVNDGDGVIPSQAIGTVQGSIAGILSAERTALNFLQRLSGIATMTHHFVEAVKGTGVRILDTRKTTPCLRWLEKYAVRQGGGTNHRFGLYDMVLIKDNHIDAAGGIRRAVERCFARLHARGLNIKIEVECRTLEEVREASQLNIHRIMLDNMDVETMVRAVKIIAGRQEVEASGNVTLKSVRSIAETGVDFISVGGLTHSSKALDISFIVTN